MDLHSKYLTVFCWFSCKASASTASFGYEMCVYSMCWSSLTPTMGLQWKMPPRVFLFGLKAAREVNTGNSRMFVEGDVGPEYLMQQMHLAM